MYTKRRLLLLRVTSGVRDIGLTACSGGRAKRAERVEHVDRPGFRGETGRRFQNLLMSIAGSAVFGTSSINEGYLPAWGSSGVGSQSSTEFGSASNLHCH